MLSSGKSVIILEVRTALHSSLSHMLTTEVWDHCSFLYLELIFKVILLYGQPKDKESRDSLLTYFANCVFEERVVFLI